MNISHAGTAREGWLYRTQTFQELRRSALMHLRTPLLLATVILGSLLQFWIKMLSGRRSPVADDLAGMFAPPPLDSFSWVQSGVGRWQLIVLLGIRTLVVWLFICLVLGLSPTRRNLLRTSGAYLASVLFFLGLFAGFAWFGPFLGAGLAGALSAAEPNAVFAAARLALGLVYAFLFIPLLVVSAFVFTRLIARAAAGQTFKLQLKQGSVWVLVTLSAVLYLPVVMGTQEDGSVSAISFFRAFLLLSIQSLIAGAIVHATAGSAALRTLASDGRAFSEAAPG